MSVSPTPSTPSPPETLPAYKTKRHEEYIKTEEHCNRYLKAMLAEQTQAENFVGFDIERVRDGPDSRIADVMSVSTSKKMAVVHMTAIHKGA